MSNDGCCHDGFCFATNPVIVCVSKSRAIENSKDGYCFEVAIPISSILIIVTKFKGIK